MATIITTAVELQAMENDLAEDYELGGDIDASDTINWNSGQGFAPVGADAGSQFTGTFHGRGYTITGLYMNRSSGSSLNIGLFGVISGATVQYVKLTGASITGSTSGSNVPCGAGILAGRLIGATLICCHTEGAVVVTCDDTGGAGSVHGNAGGLVGHVSDDGTAIIDRCCSTASVSSTALHDAKAYAGGLVGIGYGSVTYAHTITDCCARGSVSADDSAGGLIGYYLYNGTIDNDYSTGAVSGSGSVGGLIGKKTGTPTVTNCFWDTETSGQAASEGGTGKTTAQMKTLATFTDAGWDFASDWDIRTEQNDGYPYLRCGFVPSLVFPVDPVIRVSSIRRVYRPGLYRMEVALGDLGFNADMADPAVGDVPDEVTKPEWVPPYDPVVIPPIPGPDYFGRPLPPQEPWQGLPPGTSPFIRWLYGEDIFPGPRSPLGWPPGEGEDKDKGKGGGGKGGGPKPEMT